MNWYYVEAGQQAGPLDDAQFRQLVLEGRIRAETLVWREGMPEWLPYQQVFEQSQAAAGITPGASQAYQPQAQTIGPDQAVCVECGRVFHTDDMISYGTARVCADCKPLFLQKLAEGVPVSYAPGRRPLPVNADALIAEVLAKDYQVDLGRCISRGWQLVKANLGIAVGATFLVMLVNQLSGFIPILGAVLALVIQGPLLGGLNVFYLKLIRGEQAGLAEAFSGFSKRFWPLCGTFLLMVLLIAIWFIPFGVALAASGTADFAGWMALAFFGLAMLGVIWLGIAFIFALPLAADLELGPWDALRTSFRVVSRHWFQVFALVFVSWLLSMLGLVACIIGILLTLPIYYAATLYAYEDIFGVRS